MAKKTRPASKQVAVPNDKLLPKLTTFFFNKPLLTLVIWLVTIVFGALSYTTFLRREGFPSVNIPIAIVSGTYFVNDPSKVDQQAAQPITAAALKQAGVKNVQTQSSDNFFVVSVQYDEGVDGKQAAKELEQTVADQKLLPADVKTQFNVPYFGATGPDVLPIDLAISFYDSTNKLSTQEIAAKAQEAVQWLQDKKLATVESVFLKDPFQTVTDPLTQKSVTVQKSFDRFGMRQNTATTYYNSVIIGIKGVNDVDVIKLDKEVHDALHELEEDPAFVGMGAEVSASFAPQIKDNISELQKVLIEGLIAVLVVGSIVIAWRASLITVVSMITVLLATLGLLYLVGYTLNVITLFALILSLALIVDDTIIMVEAIDAARHKHKDPGQAVSEATRKVSRAMVAATLTAALSFAPLLFVSGVLGSFIRAIPVTIISSLLISLLIALIFIPFFARFLLLGKKHMGNKQNDEFAAGFEAAIANFITKPMLWARHSRKKLFFVGGTAVALGLAFIFAGLVIGRNVVFNIFPPTKDTNGLILQMSFAPNSTIASAQEVAAQVDDIAKEVLDANFVQASYFASGSPQSATEQIEIISYNDRSVTSIQLAEQLQKRFDNFDKAQVVVGQVDVGPPSTAFVVQIDASNREAAYKVANDMAAHMNSSVLKRPNGSEVRYINTTISSQNQFLRSNGKPIVTVSSGFDGTDTSTIVTLAQDDITSTFNAEKLRTYGLNDDAVNFDIGQESENQDSFKTLALAFPVLLFVMFILLAVQFKSLLQPLLIFMAIPFSIFGIMLGLDITNNPISFFAMLGFFALIGLSIKNTILLTDFANQARRQGLSPIESAAAALRERFRPLFATSMTAVVSLIPLAISSPFWEGLAVVLIFGLLSSTFLVVTVFPYYYLGAEFLRLKYSAKQFFIWLVPTLVVVVAVAKISGNAGLGVLIIPLSFVLIALKNFFAKRV